MLKVWNKLGKPIGFTYYIPELLPIPRLFKTSIASTYTLIGMKNSIQKAVDDDMRPITVNIYRELTSTV